LPTAKINGCTLHYQQLGRGRDLVLIHGLLGNLAFWYFSVLPQLLRDFRVTLYDLRGHGRSEIVPRGYRTTEMAEDLRGLVDHLGIERAHLVGHSFGGAVAMHYAANCPDRALSLTLADAWVPGLQRSFPPRNSRIWALQRLKLRRAGFLIPDGLPIVAYGIFEELSRYSPRFGGTAPTTIPGFSDSAAKHWTELVKTTTLPSEIGDSEAFPLQRIRDVTTPVLAIYGQFSHCLPTLRGIQKNLSHCEATIIPGVGHLHPLLQPSSFADSVKRFTLRLPEASPSHAQGSVE
jgi:pimeloyl-ACP methyl ester carboxylesterase